MTMINRMSIAGLVTALLLATQAGTVAAADHSEYPDKIQDTECPDLTDAPFNESLNTTGVTSCWETEGIKFVKQGLWSSFQNVEGVGNWAVDMGQSLRNSSIPGVTDVGTIVREGGSTIVSIAHDAESRVLNY